MGAFKMKKIFKEIILFLIEFGQCAYYIDNDGSKRLSPPLK
jgi:hypothetical protein